MPHVPLRDSPSQYTQLEDRLRSAAAPSVTVEPSSVANVPRLYAPNGDVLLWETNRQPIGYRR